MSKYHTAMNAQNVLDACNQAGVIPPADNNKLTQFIFAQQSVTEVPLSLRIIAGVGAFIAAFFFIGFLSISKIINFDSEGSLIIWGMLFIGGAIGLLFLSDDEHSTVKQSFVLQLSFCSMAVGKILFVIGCALLFKPDETWGITFGLFIVTLVTYFLYRVSLDRFISTFATCASLTINILWQLHDNAALALDVFLLIQMIIVGVLFTHSKISREFIPLAYGIAFSLCFMMIFMSLGTLKPSLYNASIFYHAYIIRGIMALALIGCIFWAAGHHIQARLPALISATAGALLLGAVSTGGVILSIIWLILGYAKHERLLMTLGALFLPLFLFMYYYNLNISFLLKSQILIASGAVLLAGRAYMAFQKWDRE